MTPSGPPTARRSAAARKSASTRFSSWTRASILTPSPARLGRESAGVPPEVHAASDLRLRIPMTRGLRSINVAVAAALVLGEALAGVGAALKAQPALLPPPPAELDAPVAPLPPAYTISPALPTAVPTPGR